MKIKSLNKADGQFRNRLEYLSPNQSFKKVDFINFIPLEKLEAGKKGKNCISNVLQKQCLVIPYIICSSYLE